jgi:hypothetical protein
MNSHHRKHRKDPKPIEFTHPLHWHIPFLKHPNIQYLIASELAPSVLFDCIGQSNSAITGHVF